MKSQMLLVMALLAFMAAIAAGYWGLRLSQAPEPVSVTSSVSRPSTTDTELTEQEDGERRTASDPGSHATAVVLAQSKEAYSIIVEDDLVIEKFHLAPPGSFSDMEDVVGRKVWRDTPAGTILAESSFGMGGPLAHMIQENERALAIEVNEVVSSGGYLHPGDFVDVLLYLSQDNKNSDRTMQVVVPALRVLSVGSVLGATLEGEAALPPAIESEGERRRSTTRSESPRTAVLAIPASILTRFALAAEVGQLRLAVRSADEELMSSYLRGELRDYEKVDQQLYQFEKFALSSADRTQSGLTPPAPPGVEVFRGATSSREQP